VTPPESRTRLDELHQIQKRRALTHEERIELYGAAIDSQADALCELRESYEDELWRTMMQMWRNRNMSFRRYLAALSYSEKVAIAAKLIQVADQFRKSREKSFQIHA
jgi:hypothetical protein